MKGIFTPCVLRVNTAITGEIPSGGREYSLFALNGYVPLNTVWFSGSWVLNRVYDFTDKRLEQNVNLDRKPWTGCERWRA